MSTLFQIFIFATLFNQIWGSNKKQPSDFVRLGFKKKYGDLYESASSHIRPKALLQKRDATGYEIVEITNQQSFYSVELEIGTPSQDVEVLVDTGSSDLWVTGSDNPYCENNRDSRVSLSDRIDCREYGTFDTERSRTWRRNESADWFYISYGDTTFASGVWGQDRLHLEDLNITGLSFAVANRTNSSVGVLGVGLPGLQVTSNGRRGYQYDNFPMVLQRAGATKANAYSLFLNNLDEEHGSILFGAVDHSKYTGSLYTIPLINTLADYGYPNPIQFDVTIQGIGLSSGSESDDNTTLTSTQIPGLLDSGTTLTYLPKAVLDNLADTLGISYDSNNGYYVVPCNSEGTSSSAFDDDTQLVFDFGGFHIDTPLNDYLIQAGRRTCILGLVPQDSNNAVLGDTFLTHAYVVYDLERLEISMAQAKFIEDYDVEDNENSNDIEVIEGSEGVPRATKAAGYSSTWSTAVRSIASTGNIFTLHPHATKGNPKINIEESATSGGTITSSPRTSTITGSVTGTAISSPSATTSSSETAASNRRNNGNIVHPNTSYLLEGVLFVVSFIFY